MSQKSSKWKYIGIALLLIIIILGVLIVARGRRDRLEVADDASQILSDLGDEIETIGRSWASIESDLKDLRPVDLTYETSSLNREIEYTKTARQTIADMKDELESIKDDHDDLSNALDDLGDLELRDWHFDYVDLHESILSKDNDRVAKTEELLGNLDSYYKFSEQFLEGLIANVEMEESLQNGIDEYLQEDYSGAREEFENAKDKNSEVEAYVEEASAIMDFSYLDKIETNRDEAEEIIEKFIQVCDLVDQGSYDEASDLYEEADEDYISLDRLHISDFKTENTNWWTNKISSVHEAIKELTRDIDDLEYDAKTLVQRNT